MNYSTSPRFLLTASWVLPVVGEPIKAGGLIVNAGKIEAVLTAAEIAALLKSDNKLPHVHLEDAVLTPGLFNLHTHLDYTNLSHLNTFAGDSMFDWLEELVTLFFSDSATPETLAQSALHGATESALAGTVFVVDSTFMGAAATALAQVGLKGLVGLELFGLDQDKAPMLFDLWQERLKKLTATAGGALAQAIEAGRIRLTVAPHAPYTVSPPLWAKAQQWAKERNLPLTCHLAESDHEENWIKKGDERLEQYLLKVMPPNPDKDLAMLLKELPWRGLGQSPTEHLDSHELLDEGTIAAHCLKTSEGDLNILARRGVKVALCPRSNAILKNGEPRAGAFIAAGITVGLGTDSLASSPSLSMLEEGRYLRLRTTMSLGAGAPGYGEILKMLTLDSARAVGLEGQTGSLEVGKCADVAAFTLDKGSNDLGSVCNSQDLLAALFEDKTSCSLLLVDGKAVVSDGRLL